MKLQLLLIFCAMLFASCGTNGSTPPSDCYDEVDNREYANASMDVAHIQIAQEADYMIMRTSQSIVSNDVVANTDPVEIPSACRSPGRSSIPVRTDYNGGDSPTNRSHIVPYRRSFGHLNIHLDDLSKRQPRNKDDTAL